jgi:asparaginyl-tRNA synthetase
MASPFLKALETETDVETVIRGSVHSIESPRHGGDCAVVVVRANRSLNQVRVPASMMKKAAITQECIIELTVQEQPAGAPPVAVAARVRSQALPLPVDMKRPDLTDLTKRHLHVRSDPLRATAMFRHVIQKYARDYLESQGCILVQTPVLTKASAVSSGSVFQFPYYGDNQAVLTQTNWMAADCLVNALERVYAFGPTFRREEEQTAIHLVEIWQICADFAWASNDDLMDIEEGLFRHIAHGLRGHSDLYALAGLSNTHLEDFDKPFARITYGETVERLRDIGHSMSYGNDYSRVESYALAGTFDRPFFITHFPISLKNFWFPTISADSDLTPTNDLYAHTGQGEIVGGGERSSDVDEVINNLKARRYPVEKFEWIIDVRRYGCVPHAGFSLGFDRLVSMFMGTDDIRKATLFPRMPHEAIKP